MCRKSFTILVIILLAFVIPVLFLSAQIVSVENTLNQSHIVSYSPINSIPGSQVMGLYSSENERLERQFTSQVTLAAVGDIMIHSPQFNSAYIVNKNTYDFRDHFSLISPYLEKADLVVGNLETTLTGPPYPYSGYPRFNSPPELAKNLKDSGFDLLFTANNHSLDYGEFGIINTINHIESAGLNFVGTARCLEEQAKGLQISTQNVDIAFFAYTYGTNGIPVPYGKEYLVSLLDEKQIIKDAQRAKNDHSVDVVIISLHWGLEYQRLPTEEQRELARSLIDAGVDVIIGTHPHVVQPAEKLHTENHSGLVLYSLGNFVSNQRKRYRDSGIIVYLSIEKDHILNQSTVSLAEIEPTWVYRRSQFGPDRYSILPVKELLNDEEKLDETGLTSQDIQRMKEVLQETEDIFWRFWY